MANELNTSVKGSKTSPAEEREHDVPILAKRVVEIPSNLQQRIEYNANRQAEYIGYAARGVAESAPGWLLQKLEYNANRQQNKRTIAYDSWANYTAASYC